MELVIEVPSDDPLMGNRILQEIPAQVGAELAIPNTKARLGLLKMPPEWDRQSRYNGTFTFFLRGAVAEEIDTVAQWLKDRFFGRAEGLTIDGLPIGDDVLGHGRWTEVIHEAMVRRATGA